MVDVLTKTDGFSHPAIKSDKASYHSMNKNDESPEVEQEEQINEEVEESQEESTEESEAEVDDSVLEENRELKEKLAKTQRELKRATRPKEAPAEPVKAEADNSRLLEKAYLNSLKITDPEEQEIVFKAMKSTGDSIELAATDEFVLAKIKAHQDNAVVKAATPKGSKRSGTSARNQVDYWINKGELPPEDQPDLRRAVVNEKIKRNEHGMRFGAV